MCDNAHAPPVQETSASFSSKVKHLEATAPKKRQRSTYAEMAQCINPNASAEVLKNVHLLLEISHPGLQSSLLLTVSSWCTLVVLSASLFVKLSETL
ncbi:hypothetical protein DSO57_1032321 [Entomophthora muscae]|uniref:Uncharacterized protein n=1 Tax=Entomophthora muscae TaxID=34485 RepID=A0ACC2TMT5_9FUNG|nr:hypothetical protein DSO57_1032321 [Entomophthora muscae]